jgi:hypothetical protein
MNVQLYDSFQRLSESDLDSFQSRVGVLLPQDYRRFLLASNGGCFHIPVLCDVQNVNRMLGVGISDEIYNIEWMLSEARKEIPPMHVPVCALDSESLIVISGVPETLGKLYYVEADRPLLELLHEIGLSKELRLVANSFEEFWDSLTVDEVELGLHAERSPVIKAILVDDGELLKSFSIDEIRAARDRHERPALHLASRRSRLRAIDALVKMGANVNEEDVRRRTPLSYASGANAIDCISLLLHCGAELDYRSSEGTTALHRAVSESAWRAAQLLITAGARCDILDSNGATALEYCLDPWELEALGRAERGQLHLRGNG